MFKTTTRMIVLATTAGWAGAAAAQNTGTVPQSLPTAASATERSDAEADAQGVGDIIVTAQRRSENLQTVPIAVAAVSGDQLVAAGVSDLEALRQVVPGLTFNSIQTNVQPRLRGIGSSSAGPGIEPGVAVYVDGVYYASATGALFQFNNVEQVSVLKGPQGTLFGRNAVAGLVQITTKTPGQTFEAEAKVGYGNYDTKEASFYVAGPLGADIAMDFAGIGTFQGKGYGRNLTLDEDTKRLERDVNLRSKIVFTPSAATTLTLSGDYSNTSGTQGTIRLERGTIPAPGTGPAFGGSVWDVTADVRGFNAVEAGGGNLKIEQDVGRLSLLSITAYRKLTYRNALDLDVTATPLQGIDQRQDDRQFSQELQLQSPSTGAFKWTFGLYYFAARAAANPLRVLLFGPAVDPAFPVNEVVTFGEQRTRSVAGYGQASYDLPTGTTLTLGARYTWEERKVATSRSLGLQGPIPDVPLPSTTGTSTFEKPTFRVSIDQQVNDDVMAYVSFNRGFKSGGYNAQELGASPFRPEILDAYEAGLKTRLLDHRATLNGSFFYYDYQDIQIQRINADGSFGILNGAKARAYGVDVDLALNVVDGLQITGGFEYLNTKFLDFPSALISSPDGGIPIRLGSAAGNQLPIAPEFSASLSANYRYELAGGSAISANLAGSYNAGWFTEPDNLFRQPDFVQVNGKLQWSAPSDRYSVGVWVENLTNAEVRSNAGTLASGSKFASFAPPRTYGLTLGFKY